MEGLSCSQPASAAAAGCDPPSAPLPALWPGGLAPGHSLLPMGSLNSDLVNSLLSLKELSSLSWSLNQLDGLEVGEGAPGEGDAQIRQMMF